MPDWLFPLPIFPEGSLASSVVTTVWVGVFVISFFNLRFGWVLSGLVVPGYLVPLLIARPLSFAVILLEASVTYFVVWLFSERMSGGRTWSSLFGRDRFVGLVLASILVRLTFDAWLLPLAAAYLEQELQLTIDWGGNLHSFGLIVIALLANQLWKPGYLRGMSQALVTIGLTFLVVRYGLMELTNFRISAVAYLYEDIASSILASPKAYIILVVTAFLASRMNLRYGWDFNGVLIPALIALQWYQPFKVLASFTEAFVIYGLAILILRLPVFANMTIEGARKVLLFFNISFIYRLLLGHALFWIGADVQVTDYYGFGYLLSTLMAIKMFDKDILARLTRATLQVSVLGAALGSAIGFALAAIPTSSALPPDLETGRAPVTTRGVDAHGTVGAAVVAAYASSEDGESDIESPASFETFRRGVRLLLEAKGDQSALEEAAGVLNAAGYQLQQTDDGALVLSDEQGRGRRGTFLIDPQARTELVVSVPDPIAVPGLALAALRLMRATGAGALALSGTSAALAPNDDSDVERNYATYFQAFHEAVAGGVLWVGSASVPSLRIPRRLPPGLDVVALEQLAGEIDTRFGRDEPRSVQESAATSGFAVLRLDLRAVRRVLAQEAGREPILQEDRPVEAQLLELTAASETRPNYEVAELLYFDREVLTPILTEVVPNWTREGDSQEIKWVLGAVGAAAEVLGYGVVVHRHEVSGRDTLVLAPVNGRGGIYAFRLAPSAEPFMVQVPRTRTEANTLEYGLSLFERLDAFAVLAPGALTQSGATTEEETDLLDPRRPATLFDLVSQAVLRDRGEDEFMVVQPRGFAVEERETPPPFDAVVAFDVMRSKDSLGRLGDRLIDAVTAGGADVGVVRGQAETAGFEFGWVRQARYLDATEEAEFAIVWLSAATRAAYADRIETGSEGALFDALGIPTQDVSPTFFLAGRAMASSPALPADLIEAVEAYQWRRDSVALRQAQVAFGLELVRLADPVSRQTFLAVLGEKGEVRAIANLAPPELAAAVDLASSERVEEAVERFVQTRAAWLWIGAAP